MTTLTVGAERIEDEMDGGYSWWPAWASGIEELGYLISEDGHPWLTIFGGVAFLGLLILAVASFALLAPAPL